jgi:hypothetical protein
MPVTLRSPNNPNVDSVILTTIMNVMHLNAAGQPCTFLASIDPAQTGLGLSYVQNKYKMVLGMTAAQPYACHLSSGKQKYGKNSTFEWTGMFEAIIEWCARWDENASSIDTIRTLAAADLERLKANIETNDALVMGGQGFTISVPSMNLSEYKMTLNSDFPGLTLVERTLFMQVNILPYLTTT